ncbi:MAG: DNA-formamidopyrimidine glycosylase [Homoserinimonas sp.]|jgi:formamidopyrimidine-DNA glycosylase|nr:DNA-formamidopyrimidine glycosylase [Homoserinimonas sp.]
MPELPEVEVVRAGLEPAVSGATVATVTVFDERSLRRHPGPSEDFIERLTGRTIISATRRGKFLWLPLNLDTKTKDIRAVSANPVPVLTRGGESPAFSEALVVHLGMSGQVLLRKRSTDDRLTRIRLDIVHPEHGALRLNFVDQRIFGSMAIDELVPTADGNPGGFSGALPGEPADTRVARGPALLPSRVAHIARDPLDPHFDDIRFLARLAARKTGIKRALLDQTLISGIGNIYADEALWAARIHYNQPTNTLSRARAKALLFEVRLILGKALAEGGTSFDTQYLNVNGESGYFAHSLNAYGQHGNPCPRCGRLLTRDTFMNRGSHYCAFCQRLR